MKRITMTLTDELADRVRLEAERRQTSVSKVMRILVAEALGLAQGKRSIAFTALFDDPGMVRAEDTDTLLEKEWADYVDRYRR